MLASLAVAVACREPTEITIVIKTGEKCTDLSGVEIVVGPDQAQTQTRFEQQFTAAQTHECDATGTIGTLVVTPGGSGGTIVVAAGVAVGGVAAPDPTTCAMTENAKHCIIARRSFSFISHSSLTLPIELDPLCLGKACDPASTCFKGSCVNAAVTCSGSDCGLAQENPGQGMGSGTEAGSSDGAYDAELDGMSFEDVTPPDTRSDATMIADAMPDAVGMDAGSLPMCGFIAFNMGIPNSASCDPANTFGTVTPGACGDAGGAGQGCCHCRCDANTTVACTVNAMSMSCRSNCQ